MDAEGRLAGARMQVAQCVGVKGPPTHLSSPFNDAPLLIEIGERDNNTPNLGAAHVTGQHPGARTVWHGDEHAAFLLGNQCLGGYVRAYLTDACCP
ncbi:alpha/beta hydrolase [Lentzea sp. NPDC006480]|uniref:alpha/beta hydrolase n=1 Tax=Lentzea sp. NPDC006480 TaxID=3157176 RepID=UPI0033A61F77